MSQRKEPRNKRTSEVPPLFVRLTERENRVIEAAIKLRYGEVEGNKSQFVRQAVLYVAAQIIREKRQKSEG